MKRVDFTYWPETGRIEWHGHTDDKGDSPAVPVPPIVVADALGAFTRAAVARAVESARPAAVRRCG